MHIASEEAARLKLEIWREIMRARESVYPGGLGGQSMRIPVPDPVACAASANLAFSALYPPALTVTMPTPRKRAKRR